MVELQRLMEDYGKVQKQEIITMMIIIIKKDC